MSRFTIRPARADEGPAILEIMRPWNMHHVPSAEMGSLDLSCFFVAEADGVMIGAAGYKLLGPGQGKTTLLAVLPAYLGSGAGAALQDARLQAMAALGVDTVTTNADRPETIEWYQTRFGYRQVGKLAKVHDFGRFDIDHWTTLQMDLGAYMQSKRPAEAAGQ